jgi:hypothetical protein
MPLRRMSPVIWSSSPKRLLMAFPHPPISFWPCGGKGKRGGQNAKTSPIRGTVTFVEWPCIAATLRLSAGPLEQLAARFGDGVEWMPFCRTLGVLRMGARGQALDVLQISVRTPLFLEPDWSAQLIEEARDIRFYKAWSSDSTYLKGWIHLYRGVVAEREHPGLDDEALAIQYGDDLARRILESSMFTRGRLFEVENNPYERGEGFWTMLAGILPPWRDRFPLKKEDVAALLRAFDAAYDESWQTLLRDLSLWPVPLHTRCYEENSRSNCGTCRSRGRSSVHRKHL